jgi:dGTPase
MKNNFYNEFDTERLHESPREDYRSPFQIDRDRVIHSSEFRRLQGKTQVFLPGEYDFYRTRLTHSIEVAQIGRSICNYISKVEKDLFDEDYFIDPDLVEAACLAHDLGHPPFGHAGERTLHKLMKTYGGFEGNAQTLRLITEVFYRTEDSRRGMNPCRAFLDSVLKYKKLFGEMDDPFNHFLYDYQKTYLDFVFNGEKFPAELEPEEKLNNFRSIECQIMDWADDTAYAVNDLVDSISGGFITIAKLVNYGNKNSDRFTDSENKYLEQMIDWIKASKFKAKFGSQIGDIITACKIKERSTFMDSKTNRYKYILEVDKEVFNKVQFYKNLSVELVFRSPQLHQLEFKGDFMISKIFNVLEENYIQNSGSSKLVPDFSHNIIRNEADKIERSRLVCDYVAGMTDSHAMRNYKRLFDPDYSSLVDLV